MAYYTVECNLEVRESGSAQSYWYSVWHSVVSCREQILVNFKKN